MNNFITFEGSEGCGKSTQSKMLQDYFTKNNIPSITTREPGGTKLAEKIRELLLSDDFGRICSKTEILLNYAARKDHIKKLINPALDQGKKVISDRFFDSTFAYQGYARGVSLDLITIIHQQILKDFAPDITFLIDIDVTIAMKRVESRGNSNKFDRMNLEFYQKIRDGFLQIAKNNPDRIKIIDGNQSADKIHQDILKKLSIN
ncbi:dTMP kinase [Rickettsiales bacterium]|nr:dTMP kinase [Rickettsiales bacterium]